jgi:hypothetical protein
MPLVVPAMITPSDTAMLVKAFSFKVCLTISQSPLVCVTMNNPIAVAMYKMVAICISPV